MSELRVVFPKPCSQSWDEMQPEGCNRHCSNCDTLVHDLSAMSSNEVQKLLNKEEKVCARAEVSPGGKIKTVDDGRVNTRSILVCAGALLAAACQTTPGGREENGYKISGQVFTAAQFGGSTISNSEGDTASLMIGNDGRFDVHDLRPGSYSVEIVDYCGEKHQFTDIVIVDQNVDLGRLELDTMCIIVGHLLPTDQKTQG